MRLAKEFFNQNAVALARDLIGKGLVREIDGDKIVVRIVETEAYVGPEDKGCHAYNNKRTKRTETMFQLGGQAYIYLIYGMYHCLNVVAADEGKPEAVLIRAVEPISGLKYIQQNRIIKSKKIPDLTNGPGKLCQALKIDKSLNGYDLVLGEALYIIDFEEQIKHSIACGPRINIDYAEEYKEVPWRFFIEGHPYVSR
jgi:DNA-3-methyladenine glycosylase